jgi:hypothetical protein
MLPEEDRGPSWLRDYFSTDFSQIDADIEAMEKFAAQLSASVTDGYAPHLSTVSTAMMTQLPGPAQEFIELRSFLLVHREAQDVSHQNVYNYANGTQGLASAAQDVGRRYEGADAFAHARAGEVERALDRFGVPATVGPGDSAPAGTGGDV